MEQIQIIIGGKELTFKVEIEHDTDHGAPWEEEDGHGPVTGWECRDHYKGGKRPGELILNSDGRGNFRFYDFAEACRIALADGWDAAPHNDGSETKRQQAAKAARADYENLRAWCNDEWQYVGVIVTLLDDNGEETEISDSLWCIENSDESYTREQVRLIADELASGYGTRWGEIDRVTFGYLKEAA